MRLVSFRHLDQPGFGIWVGEEGGYILSLSARWPSLKHAIATASIADLRSASKSAPGLGLAEVELDIPVPDAERYVCAGLNFRAHVLEGDRHDVPSHPSLFLRLRSTFVAHEQPILKPNWSDAFDYEAELAVVIGKGGRHISRVDAMNHVFGYTLLMDGSMRDIQFDHSLTAGKNFFASGSIGPWVVPVSELGPPTELQLIGRVNGQQRQSAPLSDLIFDIPTLISYWSRVDALSPGDLISVGTPSGVGFAMQPKQFLQPGDVVETEVPGIGVLRNQVATDPS